jgi:hypothetical protein
VRYREGGSRQRPAIRGTLAAGALVAGTLATVTAAGAAPSEAGPRRAATDLPVKQIENIMQADGTVSRSGILEVDQARSDLSISAGTPSTSLATGVIHQETFFQSLGKGRAIVNGDLALRPQEIQPVIDALGTGGLVFQAEHQHLYDMTPMVWFVHFRGTGDPLKLARSVQAAVKTTATPLPQRVSASPTPTTSLPAQQIGKILGGEASVGRNGTVSVNVPRTDRIRLGGVTVDPGLNVSTGITFQPTSAGQAIAIPDFSMTAKEVDPVTKTMRANKWLVECLYNQETAESPQLYFAHMFKAGNPITLARQIRAGLDHTAAKRTG